MVENLNKFLKDFDRKDKTNKKKMSEDEYKEWRKRQAATLNTMLKKQDHITKSLVEADRLAAEVINRNASLVYSEGFNYGTYQIESVGEVDTAFVLYDADTIERLIKDDPNLLPVNPNIPKIEQWNHSHITTAITQGIIQGESIPKIAKRLQIVVGMDERASLRNARTATTGAENAGRMASYRRAQALGINVEKKWLATYDSRTRHSHAMIDGERAKVDAKFSNRCRYPGDPEGPPSEIFNCRCTLIPVVDGKDDNSWKDNVLVDDKGYEVWKEEHRQALKKRGAKKSATAKSASAEDSLRDAIVESYDYHISRNNLNAATSNDVGKEFFKVQFTDMDPEIKDAMSDQLATLCQKYDTTLQQIRPMDKMEFAAHQKAFASTQHNYSVDSSLIMYNPVKIKDVDRVKELIQKGWMADVDESLAARYCMTHEFGHTLIDMVSPLDEKTNWLGADYKRLTTIRKEINSVYDKYINDVVPLEKAKKAAEMDAMLGDESAWDKAKELSKELKSKKVSTYSLESSDEFMAECFAHHELGGRDNEYVDAIMAIINKHFRR